MASWPFERHLELAAHRCVADMVEAVAALPADEREAATKGAGRAVTRMAKEATDRSQFVAAIRLAVVLGVTPSQFLKLLGPSGTWLLSDLLDGDEREPFVRANMALGPDWAAELIERCPRRVDGGLVDLLLELVVAHDLPMPALPSVWEMWVNVDALSLPRPGCRWVEQFLAACAAPDVFAQYQADKDWHREQVAQGIAEVRATEQVDDDALAAALVGIIERGDRPGAQRAALHWAEALGVSLVTDPDRIITALPLADGTVVKAVLPELLTPDLPAAQLDALAVALLPRKEKGNRRAVLKALDRLESPSQELRETLAQLTGNPDATTAKLTTGLLERWGDVAGPSTLGLWRDPTLPEPAALGLGQVLDEPSARELVARLDNAREPDPDLHEEALASLVLTGREIGAEATRALFSSMGPMGPADLLRQCLYAWATGRPPKLKTIPLSELVARRYREVLDGVGTLPCVLSTPTHEGLRIDGEVLAARLIAHREAGVEPSPADLLVALSRVVGELPEVDQDGAAAAAVAAWRERPVEAARLDFRPSTTIADPSRRMILEGQEPAGAKELGIDDGWTRPFSGTRVEGQGWELAIRLLPACPARPAVGVLGTLAFSSTPPVARLAEVIDAARPVDAVTAFAALALAGRGSAGQLPPLAASLLQAWDEGRLTPQTLHDAWDDIWIHEWDPGRAKVAALLTLLAEEGALQLVWPLLVRIAEQLAGTPKLPRDTGAVLEVLAHRLPEVRDPVDLPNIRALAASKGTSKAHRLARDIVAKL
ncbi:DUF6493 family protein [Arachnia propionica]|uniref:DUF7824 domain-containing protein n=1 Tax=Arachnia propionica TaxID=1750 RepID=A0A3P1WVD4_9ACTN|nr:DUF6493 family protein [Arachnia propionica]RRD48323.1 hypothetical protein EII35_13315 [Arachnia propionica]